MTQPASLPNNEAERLALLHELLVLDSAPEPLFDSFARMASEACGVPVALISLVDAERQWFKSNIGLGTVQETPRDVAFCAHALASDQVLQVPDATLDSRFAGNPLVTGDTNIRFYAGAPLVLPGGVNVGTLCVIDHRPRALTAAQERRLQDLAQLVTQTLQMRRDLLRQALAVRGQYEQALADSELRYRRMVEEQSEMSALSRPDGTLVYVNAAYARYVGSSQEQLVGSNLFDLVDAEDRASVAARHALVVQTGQPQQGESRQSRPAAAGADGPACSVRWGAWSNSLQHDAQGRPLVHSVARDITERRRAEQALQASEAFLQHTGRVAGVGGWQLDLQSGSISWSPHTRRIHEVDDDYVPQLAGAIDFYAPEARPVIQAAVETAIATGAPWDLELPLTTARGRRIWVRAVGEVQFEAGRAVRLLGAFQDITERRSAQDKLRELTEVFEHTPDFVMVSDLQGQPSYMNPALRQALGIAPGAPLGQQKAAHFLTAQTRQQFADTILPTVQAQNVWLGTHTIMLAGDLLVPVSHMLIGHRDASGNLVRYSSVLRDISAEVQAQQLLARQTATLRSVIEGIPAIVAVVGSDDRYRYVNSAFERWVGAPRDRIVGRPVPEVLGRPAVEAFKPWVTRALAGETVSFEAPASSATGGQHLAVSYIPLWLDDGTVDGFVSVRFDITQHQTQKTQLLQLTQRDPLTGLLNRAGFEDALRRCQQSRREQDMRVALLYIDLDHFKPVNDAHGHPAGDCVLQLFGQRLQGLVRPSDAVARMGGDEFAVLLVGVRVAAHAQGVADKIITMARQPFAVDGRQLHIGASVGVAFGLRGDDGWPELLARADAELYRAKRAGRGQQAGG